MGLTAVAVIVVFGVLVLVHELGHFVTAKLTGMRVDEFAIGFGPKIVSHRYGETVYSLRAVPLGGFNDIAGMDPESNEAGKRGYCEKPILSRMIVILAGSIMNLILPIFLFMGVFFFTGVSTPLPDPVLGQVLPDKPAAMAGLRDGDRIISLDGQKIASWQAFVDTVRQSDGKELTVVYERDGQEATTTMAPAYDKASRRAMVGVVSSIEVSYPGFFESGKLAIEKTGQILYAMVEALVQTIRRLSGEELSGPIGIVQMTGEVAQMGIVPLINFAALLSLNLGVINLLPIPVLDGGHFMTLLFEAIVGKPIGSRALGYMQKVGLALLIALMLFATKNDIVRILAGN